MEITALLLFSLILIACVVTDTSVLIALVAGYVIFALYALRKKYTVSAVLKMSVSGVATVKNILVTFILIGMLTALWRASGSIPTIVTYASGLMSDEVFYLAAFCLNCLVSVLTGTSFGTAATVGTIAMTMSNVLGLNPAVTGGAVLAGAFFGDRCSPVSTSALLVSELTGTDLYGNIAAMVKTSIVPFALTLCIYLGLGALLPAAADAVFDVQELFAGSFALSWITLIPMAAIFILALFRVNVKLTMLSSVICAVFVCIFCQGMSVTEVERAVVFGYQAQDAAIAELMDGGGLISMVNVAAIVCISSSYAGIFKETGLLNGIQAQLKALGERHTHFAVVLLTSIVTSLISCNQTLATMLTHQLCDDPDESGNTETAICLENSVIVISPLVPWSIAGAVPLASVGAPTISILFAFYLYLLPLYYLIFTYIKAKKR